MNDKPEILSATAPATDFRRSFSVTARTLPRRIVKELQLSWKFIRNDPVGFYPGFALTAALCYHYQFEITKSVVTIASSVLYFWLYLYTFCLTNQLAGQREDKLNKPFRPLVSGEAAWRGTLIRAVAANIAFLAVAVALDVWLYAVAWQVLSLLHNLTGLARHWAFKDFVIAAGSVLLFGPGWEIAAPLTEDSWRWVGAVAIVIFILIPLQDIRDIQGDLANERRTFPVVFGETFTRRFLAAGFALLPLFDHFVVIRATGADLPAWFAEAVTAALCWTIAWRILRREGRAYDHRTYRYFEYWYIAVGASAVVAL